MENVLNNGPQRHSHPHSWSLVVSHVKGILQVNQVRRWGAKAAIKDPEIGRLSQVTGEPEMQPQRSL